jgi:protein-disulfide isomerase
MKKFYLVLAGVAVLGAASIGWQMMKRPAVSIPVNVAVVAADTAGFEGYVVGSDSAPVTIIEFADFQCPACEGFDTVQWPEVYASLVATGKVRWIYRDFPLDGAHAHSRLASHAAACAADQGKFWEMKQKLYNYQGLWAFGTGQIDKFRGYAQAVGADVDQWQECMQSARYAGRIQASSEIGNKVGVRFTPSFVIAGRLYDGGMGSDQMRKLVDSVIAARPKATPAR